jgi:hypothetical protein
MVKRDYKIPEEEAAVDQEQSLAASPTTLEAGPVALVSL